MKPGEETESPKPHAEWRLGIGRFLSGTAWFLAALGVLVGVVALAQREVPMEGVDPEWARAYSYWSVFKSSGPLPLLLFLSMLSCLASVSFRKNAIWSGRRDWAHLLPLVLAGGMSFFLLTGAWQDTITSGIDAGEGTRLLILESKLLLLVGAVSSLLCQLITCLRLRFAQPANP